MKKCDNEERVQDILFRYVSKNYLRMGKRIEPERFEMIKGAIKDIVKNNDNDMTCK